jgi:lipopolysaccharide export system protein LptA
VDSRKVSVCFLTLALLVTGVGSAALSGCGGGVGRGAGGAGGDGGKRARDRKEKGSPAITVEASTNSFTVNDVKGRRLLEAKMERMTGTTKPGVGLQGPVVMHQAKCRLFQDGKPSMDLESPEALWDGERLYTDKTAHGVTADKKTVIDAQKVVWTADTGHLALETAKLQAIKKGQTDFTAEAPKAEVANRIVTMPASATGRNREGQQLRGDRVRWFLDTEKLEATGNVVMTDEGVRITGQRLAADTRLQKGRLSGGTRVVMQKLARSDKPARPGKPGKTRKGKKTR